MTTTMKDRVVQAVKKHGSQAKAAKALGVAESTIYHHMKGQTHTPPAGSGKSIDEFRARHDKGFIIPRRIEDGLKAMGEGWEYEAQFARIAGVALTDLSAYRDQYADYIVLLNRDGRRAWAGTKETAERMREMVGP